MTIREFVETEYTPNAASVLSVSTLDGYAKLFRSYGRYLDALGFDAKVSDCQKILRAIAQDNPHLKRSTLRHIKTFFSGVFTAALRMGYADGNNNPWRFTSVPSAPDSEETVAYSSRDIETMVSVLEAPYDLIVLFMCFSGLRKSEGRAVKWQDINLETSTLSVDRAAWRSIVKTTKNKASRAAIPLAPALVERLKAYRGDKPSGAFIFPNSAGKPLDFDSVARRIIIPALEKTEVKWAGWHAMRRGLATILHANGVPDKEVQRVLRHGQISTTQACYVKTLPENVRKAMDGVTFGGGQI